MIEMNWSLCSERNPTIIERIKMICGATVDLEEEFDVTIVVDGFFQQKPDRYADNSNDFYGYDEVEWHVEVNGQPASGEINELATEPDTVEAIDSALIEKINDMME